MIYDPLLSTSGKFRQKNAPTSSAEEEDAAPPRQSIPSVISSEDLKSYVDLAEPDEEGEMTTENQTLIE